MEAVAAGAEQPVEQVRASWQHREAAGRVGTPPRRRAGGAATPPRGGRPTSGEPARAKPQGGLARRAELGLSAPPQVLDRTPPPLPKLAGATSSFLAAQSVARTLRATVRHAREVEERGTIFVVDDLVDGRRPAAPDGAQDAEAEQEVDGLLKQGVQPVPEQRTAQRVATVLSGLLLVVLVTAVVLSVLWGNEPDDACMGLDCSACAEDQSCTWCPGPDPDSMPGYCELSTVDSDSRCGQPDKTQCVREDLEEARWRECRAQTEPVGCENGAVGCQWCNGSTQEVCVPRANVSYCEPEDLIFGSLRPFALSHRTPACLDSRPIHLDRSRELARETASQAQALAVNNSYMEGLQCAWVIECPFNTSVELRMTKVNMGSADSLQIFDGWDTAIVSQLAYFKNFAGDRSGEFSNYAGGTTSVTGGPSARLLYSSTPLLTLQLSTGSSETRRRYSRKHGGINFQAEERYEGFSLTHRCAQPPPGFRTWGLVSLGLWWVLALSTLARAYWRIHYGAKSGGLWKMNVVELSSIADAMGVDADIDGDGDVDKSELVAAITQSSQWPAQITNGLALSSFETLSTDSNPDEWVNISVYSPIFILDIFSCIACTLEGFFDILFVILQFQRPNNSGRTTGTVALCITCLSTFFHLSPAGKGILTATVGRDVLTYKQTKEWVRKYARTEAGEPLRSKDDWSAWLSSAAGKHRPSEITSVPDIEFKASARQKTLKQLKRKVPQHLKGLAPSRTVIGTESGPDTEEEDAWISWQKFLCVVEAEAENADGRNTHEASTAGEKLRSVKKKSVKTMQNLSKYISAAEKDSGEPGWLCGRPPQNAWDSDSGQVLYGRVSTPLMYLLTVLQLRVPVEGIIAWRNVKMLKSKKTPGDSKSCGLASISVRSEDFDRARCELDRALLREAIFEVLPQAVMEFQNLWADEYAVLDLMSVPGLPFLTTISEYQLTFCIMCCTILTSTVDISTPYASVSPLVGVALSASACTQLTSRLLVFGAVLSMEQEGKKTPAGIAALIFFFVASFGCTVGIHLLCSHKKLYHRGDAAYRARTATATYKISIKTEASVGSGTTAHVRITLHGEQASQSIEIGGRSTNPTSVGSSDNVAYTFEPGSTRSFSIESAELGHIVQIEVSHDGAGQSASWNCHAVTVVHEVTQKQWTFELGSWIGSDPGMQQIATVRAANEEGEMIDDAGLAVFNMQGSSWWEKLILFSFINMFTTTDKNITTSPTSRGTLVLAFWRIIESALVCEVLVPLFGVGLDQDSDGQVDRVSAFQIKSFISVYLSLGSFSCLLAASLAERIVIMSNIRTKIRWLVQSMTGQNAAFLYVQVMLMLLVAAFAAQILYEVYLLGDTGARRCRSVVLLSLLSTGIVAFVCIKQAAIHGLRFFWERRSTPGREAGTALGVVFLLVAGAWALGVSDDVDLVADLDNNPFKVFTSRCHPAQEWRAEIVHVP